MGKGAEMIDPGKYQIIKWHDSPEAFHAYCLNQEVKEAHDVGRETKVTDWGGETYDGALRDLLYGSVDRAVLAQRLFDDVVEASIDTLGRSVLTSSVVGSIPNVPAVVAGLPNSMFTRDTIQERSSVAPIRIIVDLFASHQITQQQFIRRGVAALAFTMVMNTVRPIDLYVAHTGGSQYIPGSAVAHMIKVDTRPLDLPRAVWMLSDPSFFRRLGICAIAHELRPFRHPVRKNTKYLHDYIPATPRSGASWLKLEPEDIYIERLVHGDILAITNPMQWVNNMIKQHMADIELSEITL